MHIYEEKYLKWISAELVLEELQIFTQIQDFSGCQWTTDMHILILGKATVLLIKYRSLASGIPTHSGRAVGC